MRSVTHTIQERKTLLPRLRRAWRLPAFEAALIVACASGCAHHAERACGTFGADPHIYRVIGHRTRDDLAESVAKIRSQLKTRRQSNESEARRAADGWFAAYVRRDDAWLAGWSALPFTAEGEVIAREADALKKFYGDMVAAKPTGDRVLNGINLLTPNDIRNQLGSLPPGGEPSEMLYAV